MLFLLSRRGITELNTEKSENMIKREILDYLIDNGIGLFWQNDAFVINKNRRRRTKYRPNGVPDILGLVNGCFVGIEVKKPKRGVISDDQIEFGRLINRNGGYFLVATSVNDIKELAIVNGWDVA